jgi:hypothetical protein
VLSAIDDDPHYGEGGDNGDADADADADPDFFWRRSWAGGDRMERLTWVLFGSGLWVTSPKGLMSLLSLKGQISFPTLLSVETQKWDV